MALGDEQINRLTKGLTDVVTELKSSLAVVSDESIAKLRELLKGITVNITVSVDAHEVKPGDLNRNEHAS